LASRPPRDELRPEAPTTITALRDAGCTVVMLTGDNRRTAAALAGAAGITDVHAELHPQDKAALITELGRRNTGGVAMVGDGVNDAPALATADAGIAMGAMGADVAIEAADVALMGADLRHLPQALIHARRARGIMLQNIALSLLTVLTLVPLAAFGASAWPPWCSFTNWPKCSSSAMVSALVGSDHWKAPPPRPKSSPPFRSR